MSNNIYATSALKLSDTYVNTLPYQLCTTAAGTAAKAVSAGDFALETGATVIVKFKYTNSEDNPTLNVSGTGAKSIYYKGAALTGAALKKIDDEGKEVNDDTTAYLKENCTYTFVYNGEQWDLIGEGYGLAAVATAGTYHSLKNIPTAFPPEAHSHNYAPLDDSAKIPSTYLPSYVDDIIEGYYNSGKFYEKYTPANGEAEALFETEIAAESGKIYVDLLSNKTYRWSGSMYVEISTTDIATSTANGLMSSEDKVKLDALGISYDSSSNTVTFS